MHKSVELFFVWIPVYHLKTSQQFHFYCSIFTSAYSEIKIKSLNAEYLSIIIVLNIWKPLCLSPGSIDGLNSACCVHIVIELIRTIEDQQVNCLFSTTILPAAGWNSLGSSRCSSTDSLRWWSPALWESWLKIAGQCNECKGMRTRFLTTHDRFLTCCIVKEEIVGPVYHSGSLLDILKD